MVKKTIIKKLVDKAFDLVILIKSLFGIFEVLAGVAFAISGQAIMNKFIIILAQQEISDDQEYFIVTHLTKIVSGLSVGTHIFAITYLIFHGLVNIFLAIALLKNKLWVYPWAAAGFSAFIIYQASKYLHTHSMPLLLLTIFDIFVVAIILVEYWNKKKSK